MQNQVFQRKTWFQAQSKRPLRQSRATWGKLSPELLKFLLGDFYYITLFWCDFEFRLAIVAVVGSHNQGCAFIFHIEVVSLLTMNQLATGIDVHDRAGIFHAIIVAVDILHSFDKVHLELGWQYLALFNFGNKVSVDLALQLTALRAVQINSDFCRCLKFFGLAVKLKLLNAAVRHQGVELVESAGADAQQLGKYQHYFFHFAGVNIKVAQAETYMLAPVFGQLLRRIRYKHANGINYVGRIQNKLFFPGIQ